jgi:decaprenylphospho-beta-D-ribofuranose 2-oxidase
MAWKQTEYSGWGRVRRAQGRLARPERMTHLAAIAAETPAPAIGNRRSYGDACLNSDGSAVDMTRLDRIIAFDPQTCILEAEAGVIMADLVRIFAPRGWIPAVLPGTGFATLGGCIGNDVHGKNHHGVGSFGQHVLSVTLLNGETRTVATPTRKKALFAATMGGLGQTGVIVSARMQMIPCPGTACDVRESRIESWDAFLTALDGSKATYSVGWIDATARGAQLGRGVLEEAELTAGDAPRRGKARAVPLDAPGFALSAPVVRLFNSGYYRRIPVAGRSRIRPMGDFFFPLDRIHDWNRLYGKRGFHQFQAVVPLAGADALRAILEKIAEAGVASPLAVLKRMGPGRAGPMSFPMEGYTLAVDMPARKGIEDLIAELEDMTLSAGGRIYLAKDALATGAGVRAMYPDWNSWREAVEKADPAHAMETDLVRRLGLRSEA